MHTRDLKSACAAAAILAACALFGSAPTSAAPDVFASPIHGGCYIAGPSDCRIHVEPFTINIATGKKMVLFRISVTPAASSPVVVYDWRPDQSNPVPTSGTTYTPSLVAMDFGVTCGRSYSLSLQGQDTGDTNVFTLGSTTSFTCPTSIP